MARSARLPIIVAVSLAIAATGVCSSLSAGAEFSCAAAPAPERHSSCERNSGNEACPEMPERPTCRTCDASVAFLLKDKTAGEGAPPAENPVHASLVSVRHLGAGRHPAESSRLLALSASPPLHLLNVTFRN